MRELINVHLLIFIVAWHLDKHKTYVMYKTLISVFNILVLC